MAAASAKSGTSKSTLFEWEGKDKRGMKQKGLVSSPSIDLVKAKLRRQGIVNPKVKKKRSGGSKQKITPGDISLFARQLTTMMEAGVPMVQSFEIVANGMDNKSMRDVVLGIKTEVESGSNLTNALRKYPRPIRRALLQPDRGGRAVRYARDAARGDRGLQGESRVAEEEDQEGIVLTRSPSSWSPPS